MTTRVQTLLCGAEMVACELNLLYTYLLFIAFPNAHTSRIRSLLSSSVTANVAPMAMHDLMVAALEKDAELVKQINEPLLLLHKNLFLESNPIPVKWAAWRSGLIDSPYCRPPLDELDPNFHVDVEAALEAAGLLSFDLNGLKVPQPANRVLSNDY